MADIDLIPDDYRLGVARRRMLRRSAYVVGLLAVAIVAAHLFLSQAVARAETTAAQLRAENAITQQQEASIELQLDQRTEYMRQLSLLQGLRAGAAIEDIFTIVDQAMVDGDLWFLNWGFRREGVKIIEQSNAVETGYFIVVVANGEQHEGSGAEVETHMSIKGQARDHQALSLFVRGLLRQPLVEDVSVQRTSRSQYADGAVVDFTMTVVLNSRARES